MKVRVIIPASGSGSRVGSDIPKQFLPLGEQSILWHTLDAFSRLDSIFEIAVAVQADFFDTVREYGFEKVKYIVEGRRHRAESVYEALKILPNDTDIVLVHDAARPFVSVDTIAHVIESARCHGAAIACIPVTDTIKTVETHGIITATLDRNHLWRAQTPQGFDYHLLKNAYQKGANDDILSQVTDDSALVERLGLPVHIVPDNSSNFKITTANDLIMAETYMQKVISQAAQTV